MVKSGLNPIRPRHSDFEPTPLSTTGQKSAGIAEAPPEEPQQVLRSRGRDTFGDTRDMIGICRVNLEVSHKYIG